MAGGSSVSFDYAFPPETLSAPRRAVFDALSARVAAAGEPFQLFFSPEELETELRRMGFHQIEQIDSERLNALYFSGRADGLKLSPSVLGKIATAWV